MAQYVELMAGPAALHDMLREVFDADYPPTAVHRLLARLRTVVAGHGEAETAPLILTANYDDALERALDEEGQPFEVVRYRAGDGKWLHAPSDRDAVVIERPNEYTGIRTDVTVILKLHGGIDRADAAGDSFVITEDDYVDYVARSELGSTLPVTLAARLRRSHFLFLGYGLRDWSLRVILRRIWGSQRLRFKSWAVMTNPDRIDQLLWRERDVEIVEATLDLYVRELQARLSAGR